MVNPSGIAATEHGKQNENEIFDDGNEELTASQIDHYSAGLNMGGLDAEHASFRVRRKLDVPARVARHQP
jgi:hypothetical protein